ncbi:hypothetical protein tinsulaeT_09890 [Thalassotalea insulae]|uniref:Flagellar protein FlaG n=1 Tax=Thalassotalea insulae TaxID=2056778 RepID=A0ABQ6GR33_9GAMM|nr:flagellar protein FlaG [Thalassotalea insulae]GLX77649.1 hypothetical protein tinsulaeT_09890 [Thalassotalea insulae]
MAVKVSNDLNSNAVSVNPLSLATKEQQPTGDVDDKLVELKEKVDEPEKSQLTAEEEVKELEEAVAVIADFINMPMKNINFAKDDGSDKTVIKVFDSDSKELIKQFPSDEVLEIAKRIVELRQDIGKRTGILLDERV